MAFSSYKERVSLAAFVFRWLLRYKRSYMFDNKKIMFYAAEFFKKIKFEIYIFIQLFLYFFKLNLIKNLNILYIFFTLHNIYQTCI